MAAAYEIKGDERFRVRAYDNAAEVIEQATSEVKDLWEEDKLKEIPGIGQGIASYLDEYFRTGKVKHFEAIKKTMPGGMSPLLQIPSVGPKTAYRLAKELGIETIEELRRACEKHQVAELEGFGEVSEKEILQGIAELESRSERILLPVAASIADSYVAFLKEHPAVVRADPLGSLRRQTATVGDIDIAVATSQSAKVTKHFVSYPGVSRILSQGEAKASVILKTGQQVDLMTQKPEAYGALLQHFTGSKNHNIHLRSLAQSKGLSLSEYGIKKGEKLLEYATEEEFYRALGMAWISPELREDTGEIEAAIKGNLPHLVEVSDLKGDLHSHTIYSDGENTPVEMAQAAKKLGRQFLAITDHTPSLKTHTRKEMDIWIAKRNAEIKEAGQKAGLETLAGIEVNIDTNGELAFPDEFLARYDLVLAAIHTSFNASKERMTKRFLAAAANPHVDIIAHPTGRLLNGRQGYEADWPAIFKACAQYRVAMEINCQFVRLDLPDTLVREARGKGVCFSLGSDAHNVESLANLAFGVSVARRGWCEAGDVVNTWTIRDLRKWLERR